MKRALYILGVTGVIGSGKSALCRYLEKKHSFHWIDADEVVHRLYQKGGAGYNKIKDYFGSEFVGEKEVHRGRLRRFLLKTPQKITILNRLIHGLVFHEVSKKIDRLSSLSARAKKPLRICLEAAYFTDEDLAKFIDHLIRIDSSDTVILRRLLARRIPEKQLRELLKFQRKNLPKGGSLLHNEGSLEELARSYARIAPYADRRI